MTVSPKIINILSGKQNRTAAVKANNKTKSCIVIILIVAILRDICAVRLQEK
jgi:hypothetical protein